jgi:hypothetical protein
MHGHHQLDTGLSVRISRFLWDILTLHVNAQAVQNVNLGFGDLWVAQKRTGMPEADFAGKTYA